MTLENGRRRVVVAGVGPVSPVGIGREDVWNGLIAGRSGIGPIEGIDASDLPVKLAGEVRDFDPAAFMDRKQVRRTDRFVHFAVAAARLAVEDAGEPAADPARTAVVFSTGIGGLITLTEQHRILLERGPERVSPFFVPGIMPNAAAGQIAMELGYTGPNTCVTTACAAGAHAVGEGFRLIQHGIADVCIAGGTEAVITPLALAGFAQAQALSPNPDPDTASRPFDANRDGFVLSEGACALVLEDAERAAARGARVYAEVAGYGASADAHHVTQPEPSGTGAIHAIEAALADAEETSDAVDYVNAHGTSTPLNDVAETRALRKVFGEHADRVMVSSTKSMTGHLLGAAGALEAAVAALAIWSGRVPPTIHYETPDPECDLDYVPNESRKADVRLALSNAFGFGGHNAVLAFRGVGR